MDRGDVSGEEGAVWDDEVVAQALSEFLLALCQDDAGYLGLQLLQLMIGCVIIHRITRNKRNLNRLPRITHGIKTETRPYGRGDTP